MPMPPTDKCIILIGYMCAGKTTVGKVLARQLGLRFYDLDWYIEERYHRSVSRIFAEDGEEKFRDLERRMLHEAAEFQGTVLSCGGGTPCFFDNMDYMNEVAHTIYLKASPETLCRHLAMSRGERPLLKGKSPEQLRAYVAEQLEARRTYYERAHYTIDINVLDTFEKIDHICELIRTRLNI